MSNGENLNNLLDSFFAKADEFRAQLHEIEAEIERLVKARSRIIKILQFLEGEPIKRTKVRTTPSDTGLTDAIVPLLEAKGIAPDVVLTPLERRKLLESITEQLLAEGFPFAHNEPMRSTSVALRHALARRKNGGGRV